ncbi:MAG TPA: sn-glycerol-3-phosphate ABC transporter ATP-binding protein UgpC [Devosia sp.]|nr:sn-glycerol-3-phosphate ABC transporter ATP-binding protein UgpC [Devosia sp.]
MGAITLSNVGKTYGGDTVAVSGVDLDIADGEFVVFVGPSGCGKSTLLRMIAGLETITDGEIRLDDQVINAVPPRDRDIAMVFQSYALYPQMTVRQNIAFALELRKYSRDEIGRRVEEAARILHLNELLDRKPKELSGGQRQRVAMGRAIVRHPKAFLLDEPLSNLDAKLRVQLRAELGNLHSRLGVTTIHVTHDQVEAMTLGSRVAVFSRGALQQYAAPHTLYHRPANMFVAGFIGSPAMNFFEATVTASSDDIGLAIGALRLRLPSATVNASLTAGQRIVVGARPEHLDWRPSGTGSEGLVARVRLLEHLEPESYFSLSPLDSSVVVRTSDESAGGERGDAAEQSDVVDRMFVVRAPANRLPPPNAEVDIIIDPSRIVMFDASSGAAL